MSLATLSQPAPVSQAGQVKRALAVDVGYGYVKAVAAKAAREALERVDWYAVVSALSG